MGNTIKLWAKDSKYTLYAIFCPACKRIHCFSTEFHKINLEEVTVTPSLLMNPFDVDSPLCHSFITNNQIRFLGDCEHEFKNQTLDLPEVPDELI